MIKSERIKIKFYLSKELKEKKLKVLVTKRMS